MTLTDGGVVRPKDKLGKDCEGGAGDGERDCLLGGSSEGIGEG